MQRSYNSNLFVGCAFVCLHRSVVGGSGGSSEGCLFAVAGQGSRDSSTGRCALITSQSNGGVLLSSTPQGDLALRRKREAERDTKFEHEWTELLAVAKGLESFEDWYVLCLRSAEIRS